jgi:phosphatidylinositol-3-phosphatase
VIRRLAVLAALLTAVLPACARAATAPQPPIRHVFIIVLENESASVTFGPGSPAPYLSKTLTAQGAYLPRYDATGHNSNDNYIAMISGQAPNPQNQGDCQVFDDVVPGTIGSFGQAQGTGCVYPTPVRTIADQLGAAGFTWRDYNQGMGSDPSRETAVCAHPALNSFDNTQSATAADMYATRHNPFVYFHSIIDDTTLCNTHVVNLDRLPQDLSSASRTANYTFITPDLCNDGHDAPCADGEPGGLAQADTFLKAWVPQITASPAFRQDGLLIVTFDEAATSDASSCCGEIPGPGSPEPGESGPGGGDVGAVVLSPCIAPGTVSQTSYNHYTMLGSVENLFGLSHLGYAGLPGETYFSSDIFNRACGPPPIGRPGDAVLHAPRIASASGTSRRIALRWSGGGTYTVQVRSLNTRKGQWRTLLAATHETHLIFTGALGATYRFRVRTADGPFATATTIVPTGTRIRNGHFGRGWRVIRRRAAWQQHAIQTATPGAALTLRYVGGALSVIGETTARGGVLRVVLDGRSRTLRLHSRRLRRRRIIYSAAVTPGVHHLKLVDVRGLVVLEGLAIASRTG